MLKQEINLYRYFEAANTDISIFSLKRLLGSWMIFTFLLFILYLGSLWENHQLKNQHRHLITQENKMRQYFYNLKNHYPPLFFSQDIETTLTKMETDIEAQEKILRSIEDNVPFSTYLTALSTIVVPNLWLTSIVIEQSGDEIILKGKTSDKNALQTFLETISLDNHFNLFKVESQSIDNITQSETEKNLDFQITMLKKEHE